MATLEELIAESHREAGPRVGTFIRLAAAVQEERRGRNAPITRTTALWVILQLDPELHGLLSEYRVDQRELASELSISGTPPTADVDVAEIHEYFADAIREYLADHGGGRPVDLADLALAILLAGRAGRVGQLHERLSRLSVDFDAAIAALERLIASADYSRSVRGVRDTLANAGPITAGRLAIELQRVHGGYAGGRFEGAELRRDEGATASVDEWLAQVRRLYDIDQVAKTRHEVIDGELTLLGLAELDHILALDLKSAGVLQALEEIAEALPRRQIRTDWTPDSPATEDLLGRKVLAEILAKRLSQLSDPAGGHLSSFLVHVDGPWGAGKSTLFEFLDQKLETDFVVVRVNAWRDQRLSVQWWMLLSALNRAVVLSRPWYLRPIARAQGFFDRLRAAWLPFVVALLLLVAAIVALVAATDLDLTRSGKVADSVLKIVSLTTVGFAAVAAAARFLLPSTRRSAQMLVETRDDPMAEVMRLFARSLRRAGRPTVFLIDDLDRCDGRYVVEFLEAMQTLVRDAPVLLRGGRRPTVGPYAFIAADGQWIRTSYEAHYAAFGYRAPVGRPLGFLFLEKVFQLHVRLPAITESARNAFLARLLRLGIAPVANEDDKVADAKERVVAASSDAAGVRAARTATAIADPVKRMEVLGEAAVKFSEPAVVDATEHELTRFGVFLEPNPRSMILFVNTYGVLRSLRTLEEVFVDLGPLALWAVVEVRWPYLADYLRMHPDAVAGEADIRDEDVAALLGDADVRRVLNDPRDGPLNAARIRECAGAPLLTR